MATPPRKRPLVLVVEDDPTLGDVMLTALKDDGLDAKLAHDGDEAMRDVDDLSPSVMVLDLMMPKRDGFSVLRELRADGRISHLPVIVVTAIFGMSERLYATELGAAFGMKDRAIRNTTNATMMNTITVLMNTP